MKSKIGAKIIGILLILLPLGSLVFLIGFGPGWTRENEIKLSSPFRTDPVRGYVAVVPSRVSTRYKVTLYEDGKEINSSRFPYTLKKEKMDGKKQKVLTFLATDGSDPSTNGKVYTLIQPRGLSKGLYFTAIGILYLTGLFLIWLVFRSARKHPVLAKWWFRGAMIVLTIAMFECVSWVMSESFLLRSEQGEILFDQSFHCGPKDEGTIYHANYAPHHYMNYALNPRSSGKAGQINSEYHIRRGEPIRPRSEINRRILVLGGSTTFDTQIAREEDTWVGQVEKLVREKYGNNYDVINGGVGGYTLQENMIHYITLLTHLEPDVVLLFEGINDVHPRFYGKVKWDYSNYRRRWNSKGGLIPPPSKLLRWSWIYRYYYLRRHIQPAVSGGIDILARKPYPPADTWKESLKRNPPKVYEKKLEALCDLVQGQGRAIAILPQFFTVTYPTDEIYIQGLRENNEVSRRVARRKGAAFAEYLYRNPPFKPEDFNDNCHFNEPAAKKMAAQVFEFLEREKLLDSKKTVSGEAEE
jgi:lysophospholipase L1-like esterase